MTNSTTKAEDGQAGAEHKFTILSHAGLMVESGATLVVDPWIVGSCYWRSWWNYPEPPEELVASLVPDAVYLTHLHWDHFHGPSLQKFHKRTRFVVPKFHNSRMKDDLSWLGFENVHEIQHGETVELSPSMRLTSYQFLNDSAIVVDFGSSTLLNANDTKVVGGTLRKILREHPNIDFVLRSHSNASGMPYCVEGFDTSELRPPSDYIEEFRQFSEAVSATFAVPFASNHCFLHPETERFNGLSVSPRMVEQAMERSDVDCVVMSPGSSWAQTSGFEIREFDYEDKDAYVASLKTKYSAQLSERLIVDAAARLDVEAFTSFMLRTINDTPRLVRRRIGRVEFLATGAEERLVEVDFLKCSASDQGCVTGADPTVLRIECNAQILNDCVAVNMFGVWSASKRLRIHVPEGQDTSRAGLLLRVLDMKATGLLPIRANLTRRSLAVRGRRYREAISLARIGVLRAIPGRSFSLSHEYERQAEVVRS
jgi:UDP-MurNAc hydroxylase